MTSDTDARRSVAMTGAPRSVAVPSMVAVSPSSEIRAPNRASSCTCMKRFSKIVSVICEEPPAQAISAINCACRSVGKPGNGAVDTVTGLIPAPFLRDADAVIVDGDIGAGLGQHVERRLQQFGAGACKLHVAAGHRHRHRIGAGLDPVGQHGMPRAMQAFRRPRPRSAACRRRRCARPSCSGNRRRRRSQARRRHW